MTAPLNGQLLNGARPYTDWAWGWARAEATATAEPVVNRVYSDARGTAVAEATSSGIPDRLAFLDSTQHPYAESHIEATRYADFSADAMATAELPLEATRLAWMDAPAIHSGAESSGYAERWKITSGSTEAVGESSLDDEAITRISLVYNRRTPGQARSWMAESHLKRLRVRQQYARGMSVGRATLRAIPNSSIGRARTELDAEVFSDYLLVNVYHAFRGSSSSISQTVVDTDRIRIIIGRAGATAAFRAEPTIERDGQRFSYNSAVGLAEAHATLAPTILRIPPLEWISAEAQFARAETFYRRGMRGAGVSVAAIQIATGSNTWQRARGEAKASATIGVLAHVMRDPMTGMGEAFAASHADGLALREMNVPALESEARVVADTWVMRPVAGVHSAIAALEIEAFGRRGRIMGGEISALAESTGVGLREVWVEAPPKQAVAATTRFIYRINIDGEAAAHRTIILSPSSRSMALPASEREYRIT